MMLVGIVIMVQFRIMIMAEINWLSFVWGVILLQLMVVRVIMDQQIFWGMLEKFLLFFFLMRYISVLMIIMSREMKVRKIVILVWFVCSVCMIIFFLLMKCVILNIWKIWISLKAWIIRKYWVVGRNSVRQDGKIVNKLIMLKKLVVYFMG